MGNSNATNTPPRNDPEPPQNSHQAQAITHSFIEDAAGLSPEANLNTIEVDQQHSATLGAVMTIVDNDALEEQLTLLSEEHAAVHVECRIKNEEMEELERVQRLEIEEEDERHEITRTAFLNNFELRREQAKTQLISAYAEDLTFQKNFRKYVLFQEREDMTVRSYYLF